MRKMTQKGIFNIEPPIITPNKIIGPFCWVSCFTSGFSQLVEWCIIHTRASNGKQHHFIAANENCAIIMGGKE